MSTAGNIPFRVFGPLADFTVTSRPAGWRWFPHRKTNSNVNEICNWDVVAKAMEAAGATSSQMYIRAKALAAGKLDPMPTSSPEAPYSISAVAG